MGLRVQAYIQSDANFRLSTMKKGAPNPLTARFITVKEQAPPVIMTRTKPITGGIGSTQAHTSL